jgi:hypothetical protein
VSAVLHCQAIGLTICAARARILLNWRFLLCLKKPKKEKKLLTAELFLAIFR